MITYHLALFPLSLSLADEELLGFSMIGTLCAVFAANLGIMLTVTFSGMKNKCRLRRLKKANQAKMTKRIERRNRVKNLLPEKADESDVSISNLEDTAKKFKRSKIEIIKEAESELEISLDSDVFVEPLK